MSGGECLLTENKSRKAVMTTNSSSDFVHCKADEIAAFEQWQQFPSANASYRRIVDALLHEYHKASAQVKDSLFYWKLLFVLQYFARKNDPVQVNLDTSSAISVFVIYKTFLKLIAIKLETVFIVLVVKLKKFSNLLTV